MLAFAGESERRILRSIVVLAVAPLTGRVAPAVIAAVGIGAQRRAFAVFGLFDYFFALLYLRGKRRLGGRLSRLRGLLGGANLGRVLRGGQVCQLQIRGTNRHDRLFPLEASVLLYFRPLRGWAQVCASISV